MCPIVTSTRRATPKSRDPGRSKAAILLAARDEFAEHGFSGARTSEIAKRAGVPQGLLYHYFENKDGLWGAVIHDAMEPYLNATHDLLQNLPPGDAGPRPLEAAVRVYFTFLREHPHVPRLMAWWVANQGWTQGPMVAKGALHANPMDLGVARIHESQEAGLVRADLDPAHVIRVFLHLCMYWHMNLGCVANEDGLDLEDTEAVNSLHDAHITHIVDILLRGVLVAPSY